LNPEDVWRDVKHAYSERREVRVSRSENNGRIRWVIEIERKAPLGNFGAWMRDAAKRLGSRESEAEEGWTDRR
jgi:hypothetical protein